MGRFRAPFCLRDRARFRAKFDLIGTDRDTSFGWRRHLVNRYGKGTIVAALALAVPILLAGCGGGASGTFPRTQSSSSPPITGVSGNLGNLGTGGTLSTSADPETNDNSNASGGTSNTSAPSGTGTSDTNGTSNTGESVGTGSTGTGTSGTSSTSGTTSSGGGSSEPEGTVIANLQTDPANWRSWGQVAPAFVDCSPSPCDGVAWSMKGGITTPSLSNNAMQFTLGGTTPYGDALFSPGLIGDNSKERLDSDHTLLPTVHSLKYDVDFYVTNRDITQSLEFDLSMFMNGVGMIWGQECNHLNSGQWDIWDNVNAKWVPTGFPCTFVNGWNHLTIEVERKTDNTLLYKSIVLNGTTYVLNRTYPPSTAPAGWWGLTANYQMDGNYKQTPNTTYLDNFNVTYW